MASLVGLDGKPLSHAEIDERADDLVQVPLVLLKGLHEKMAVLAALEEAGVDSWEGYGEAMRSLYKDDLEDE